MGQNVANQLVDDPAKSPIYELAFAGMRASIPATEPERLRKEVREAVGNNVLPAIRRLHEFWTKEYHPKTREAIAWTTVPQGEEWYAYLVRLQTTTDRTPEEIHTPRVGRERAGGTDALPLRAPPPRHLERRDLPEVRTRAEVLRLMPYVVDGEALVAEAEFEQYRRISGLFLPKLLRAASAPRGTQARDAYGPAGEDAGAPQRAGGLLPAG